MNCKCHWIILSVLFFVGVVVNAAPIDLLTATEGGNVTFWKGLNNQIHAILSCEPESATLLNYDEGSILIIKPNVCVENGAIVMTNVQKNDSNVFYKLQIYKEHKGTTYNFKLNVTERPHHASDLTSAQPLQSTNTPQTKDHHLTPYIAAGVAVAVLIVLGFICWKKKLCPNQNCGNSVI